jgi:NADH-quinone oxidoreductase subunit N
MLNQLLVAIPEILLLLSALALTILGLFNYDVKTGVIAILIATIIYLVGDFGNSMLLFSSHYVKDDFATFGKIIVSISALAAVGLAREKSFEFYLLLLLSTLGLFVLLSSNSLLTMYLGIETASLSGYLLAAFYKDDKASSEAGLKYFLLGCLASGLLLFGMSLIYGYTGEIIFGNIAELVVSKQTAIGIITGVVFCICGMLFKLSAAPFHAYLPDVYQGVPKGTLMFLATATKYAMFAGFARFLAVPFIGLATQYRDILVFVVILSIIIGSLGAVLQRNIRRLLAYSSISHIGFAAIALCFPDKVGITYMVIYVVMSIASVAFVNMMKSDDIASIAGIGKTNPIIAASFAAVLFSLAGIPPLAGFFAKYYVLKLAVANGGVIVAVIAVLFSAISAFYYLKIIKTMYFDEGGSIETDKASSYVLLGCVALLLVYVFVPSYADTLINKAATIF